MASKKKQELSYLQMPMPSGRKSYKMVKRSWNGLNYRQTIDTGALSMEKNISTLEAPYLTPSPKWQAKYDTYTNPIGLFGFDDFLIVIYRISSAIYVDYINDDGDVFTGQIKASGATYKDEYPRSVVQFNVYDTPTDPVAGEYVKKLLIFPDRVSMDFHYELLDEIPDEPEIGKIYCTENSSGTKTYRVYSSDDDYVETLYFPISDMSVLVKEYENDTEPYLPPDTASHNYYYQNTSAEAKEADTLYGTAVYRWVDDEADSENTGWKISIPPTMPNIKYATVHLSRVFGVDEDRVYASGYNDYTNWNLDTVDEYNESNAWCSPAQSNTKAGGEFTGITTFDNHVVCFKKDFMHEIYNTKNPFRIQDIYAEGAIDNRTIQDVDGRLIFVSEDNVKIYTGANPRIISYYLNMDGYENAVSGTDGRCYYLYCEDRNGYQRLFVYDTIAEQWSEQDIELTVLNFAHNKNGMYALCDDGDIYKIDTNSYSHNWNFETDLFTNETVDIKHIKKIQMFAQLASNARLKVYVLYDDEEFDENTSHLVYSSDSTGQIAVRVKPRQTAGYGVKLHFEGYGYARLYELEMFMEAGGGLYV